jgi:hypothetical protein
VEGEVDKTRAEYAVLYYLIKDRFQKEDELGPYTDEDAVKEEISRILDGEVAPEDIRLPIYFTKKL